MSHSLADAAERDLVARLHDRDDAAMTEIMRRHRRPVLAFARRLVGDQARAEEVTQDVFVRLWEKCDRFDVRSGTLRSFLLAITHGRSIDLQRSDLARRRREERDARQRPRSVPDVQGRIVEQSTATALRAALGGLPEVERAAVELAYFGGHSYRRVAAMLGEPEGTVKSRIRSGLARLRIALAEQDL